MRNLKKNDRVEYNVEPKEGGKPETHYGTVVRGGNKRVTVVDDGGLMQYIGRASSFKATDVPFPTDEASVMDKYEIRRWRSAGGDETERFEAELYCDGKKIGLISNGGMGGPDLFQSHNGKTNDAMRQFQQDVREWAEMMGDVDLFEPDSFWAHWWWYERKFGITGKMAVERHRQAMSELMDGSQ